MNILQTSTGTFDISSPIKVAEYTATASTLLLVQLAASGLDGSGVNACLTRTIGATRYQTGVTSQAGSTPYFPGMTMPVSTGDALGVWMEGQAADVAVAVRVEVWDAYGGSLASAIAAIDADTSLLAGIGTYSYSNTVDDGSGNLLDGVRVELATDSAFTNIVNQTHTNGSGAFTVYSDIAGTHYLRLQLAGYTFTDQTVTLA